MSDKGNDFPLPNQSPSAAGQGAAGGQPARQGQGQTNQLLNTEALKRHHQKGKRQRKGEKLVKDVSVGDTVAMSIDTAKDLLAAVRARADGWRNGAAASLALVLGSVTIKGRQDGIGAFTGGGFWLLAGLLSLSVGLALCSLYRFLRAANGPSWLDATIGQIGQAYDVKRYLRRAGGAAHDLKVGQLLWFASVVLFFSVNILVWWL